MCRRKGVRHLNKPCEKCGSITCFCNVKPIGRPKGIPNATKEEFRHFCGMYVYRTCTFGVIFDWMKRHNWLRDELKQ